VLRGRLSTPNPLVPMNQRHPHKRPTAGKAQARRGPRAARGHPERREHLLIFGIHAVEAVLANPKRVIHRIALTANAERRLQPSLAARQFRLDRVLPRDLDRRLGPETVHQGALIEAEPLPEPALAMLAEAMEGRPLLVLDQVTDPHNVGAILRSAAVFGAAGLIMTRRHSPPLEGALAKAASGALEHVPVTLVQNLARAMDELKALGVMVVGLDGGAKERLEAESWPARAALILGAEGKGLRELTRLSCDRLCCIASEGPLNSLNVSNAAAVALHWAALQRLDAGVAHKADGAAPGAAP
jgi:23S rRNA (guanosine2251-2'-O)-methyltransferase